MRGFRFIVVGALLALTALAPAAAHAAPAAQPNRPLVANDAITTETGAMAVIGQPSGCPSGAFCVYRNGNGGDLCMANEGNSTNWGLGCRNNGETLFNNGTPGLYDKVRIYWGDSYSGAWACLERGQYWLYALENRFNFGFNRAGFNQAVGNNAVSHKWSAACG